MIRKTFRDRHGAGQPPAHAGRHAQPADAVPTHPPASPWAPVVVGEPIIGFEPRPPAPGYYCPDTFADGWSTRHFTVRAASVRGYAHRYRGTPRQDAVTVVCDPASGAIVVAVADGVSSAPHSHLGATAACQAAADMTLRQLSAGSAAVDWAAVLRAAATRVIACGRDLLRTPRPGPEAVAELLATTLTAGCITPTGHGPVGSLVQVGDSGAWLLQHGRYGPVLKQKHDPHAAVISSSVTALPSIPARVTPVTFQVPPGAVLLLGTDGFGDPLGDGTGQVGRLFAEHLHSPPPAVAMAHLLDFSRETFDDDRTLLAVWPLPPGDGGLG
jgi:serine/threonine protein phosphatase PrpC